MLVCSALVLVGSAVVFRLPPDQAALLAPIAVAFAFAALTLLSLRARDRAERDDV